MNSATAWMLAILLWSGAVGAADVDLLSAAIDARDAQRFARLMQDGAVPQAQRDAWARQREAALWQEFQRDRQAMLADADSVRRPMESPRFRRWFANCHPTPADRPCEAGYWVGMRIAEAYVARARDKRAAIRVLLELSDPAAILQASGYPGAAATVER